MKQTLRDIKQKTSITTKALAEQARLSMGEVFTVETGGYSSEEIVQRVITAFNQLSGLKITLNDIQMSGVRRNHSI